MLLFRLRNIWKTVDGEFYPTRLIALTLPFLNSICSGCYVRRLNFNINKINKLKLFIQNSFWMNVLFMEAPNCQILNYQKKKKKICFFFGTRVCPLLWLRRLYPLHKKTFFENRTEWKDKLKNSHSYILFFHTGVSKMGYTHIDTYIIGTIPYIEFFLILPVLGEREREREVYPWAPYSS